MAEPRRRQIRTVAAVLCAFVAGCVTPAPPPREPVISQVPDGDWELVNSTLIGTGRIPGVPRPTLAFRSGKVSAFSGCNRASAAARLMDDWLEIGAMAATRRACPEPLSSFETRYFKLLGARPVFLVDGDTLTLVAGNESARLRRAGANSRQGGR